MFCRDKDGDIFFCLPDQIQDKILSSTHKYWKLRVSSGENNNDFLSFIEREKYCINNVTSILSLE